MDPPRMVTRHKHHRTQAVILTLQPTLMRVAPPWVRNARQEERPAQHQGAIQIFCIAILFYVSHTTRLKWSRAVDPFESSLMVHSGATGLVDDWRMKAQPPNGPGPLRSPTLNPPTPDRHTFPYSLMISPASMSTLSSFSVCSVTQGACLLSIR